VNGGLLELLIILAIILFGLFGKKKRPPVEEEGLDRPKQRSRQPGTAQRRPTRRPVPQRQVPTPARHPPPAERDVGSFAEELERLLRHGAQREPEPEPEPESFFERPVVSQATEFDDEQRHRDFHERLEDTHAPPQVMRRARPGLRLAVGPDTLREAIVWREVLGPPLSLRR
jgi:hypothetical protein